MLNARLHAQLMLTNGLVSYYPFNGNANDVVGTNNGTVHGATLTTNRFGTPNSAYSFNGSTSYIDCGSPSNLAFTNNFTFTAWLLFNGGGQNPRAVDNGQGAGYQMYTGGTGTTRTFILACGAEGISTSVSYSQKVWHSVVAVFQNGTGYIYVDGHLAASGALPTPQPSDLRIGMNSQTTDPADHWGGCINNVRFYNRVLSTNEIALLYQYESTTPQLGTAFLALGINTTNLVVGGSYQIQTSSNLVTWQNYGVPFVATSTNATQYVSRTSSSGFFRILAVP